MPCLATFVAIRKPTGPAPTPMTGQCNTPTEPMILQRLPLETTSKGLTSVPLVSGSERASDFLPQEQQTPQAN